MLPLRAGREGARHLSLATEAPLMRNWLNSIKRLLGGKTKRPLPIRTREQPRRKLGVLIEELVGGAWWGRHGMKVYRACRTLQHQTLMLRV